MKTAKWHVPLVVTRPTEQTIDGLRMILRSGFAAVPAWGVDPGAACGLGEGAGGGGTHQDHGAHVHLLGGQLAQGDDAQGLAGPADVSP